MPAARFLPLVLALCGMLPAATAGAAEPIIEVSVGWGGRFRPDRWTPAYVRAQADAPTPVVLEWYVPRPGREAMVIRQFRTLNPTGGGHIPAHLPIGPDPAALHLRVADARTGRTIGRWPGEAISPIAYADAQVRQPVFIGVSGEGPALRFLPGVTFGVAYLGPELLPRRAIGYDGLDVLALNEPDLAELELDQQEAIAAWVRAGGRLLLWLDVQSIPAASPLAELLPAPVVDFTVRRLGEADVPYTRLQGVPDEQLVTRAARGLGEVIFLHVPPEPAHAAGVAFVPDTPRNVALVLPALPPLAAEAAEAARRDSSLPGGRAPWLALAALAGPIDWLVLRRTRRRLRWWITLPGWVLLLGLLIWYLPGTGTSRREATFAPLMAGEQRVAMIAVVADTGGRGASAGEDPLAPLREIGPAYWRTLGFDRTEGPFRDIAFRQGEEGMSAGADDDAARPPFVAEVTAYPR